MTVKIGLVGTGTVGGGCLEILKNHKEDFLRHYGLDIELVSVCSLSNGVALSYGYGDVFTNDWHNVVENPNVDIVIELIGGTTTAREIVLAALNAGKNVVTANKALMASFGKEVLETAKANNCEILFEASVGGGIPIIAPLKHSLIANEISTVMGIVNGTTNYMLTEMAQKGTSYEEVLAQAQALGYAEADPSADVDGLDAAAKIAILASIAFNTRVTLDDVYAEGIRNITTDDLNAAADMGYCVKLLAIAHRTQGGVDVRVHPTMLPVSHPLSGVNGVYNAIYVIGDAVGETMFFGQGAGSGAAASAVMGDVVEMARHITQETGPLVGCTCTDALPLVPIDNLKSKYYIRFSVKDRPGVLATTAGIFAQNNVSIHSMMQRGVAEGETVGLAYVTHQAKESAIRASITQIAAVDNLMIGTPSIIRVEG